MGEIESIKNGRTLEDCMAATKGRYALHLQSKSALLIYLSLMQDRYKHQGTFSTFNNRPHVFIFTNMARPTQLQLYQPEACLVVVMHHVLMLANTPMDSAHAKQ